MHNTSIMVIFNCESITSRISVWLYAEGVPSGLRCQEGDYNDLTTSWFPVIYFFNINSLCTVNKRVMGN